MSNGYVCKTCGTFAPIGVGYAVEVTDAERRQCTERIACECGVSRTATPWAVLDIAVTRILGLYATADAAHAAQAEFGPGCFAYSLSEKEANALIESD